MKTLIEWTKRTGAVLALSAAVSPACAVDEVDDEILADDELDDEEDRGLCFYAQSQPPAYDASGTLVGPHTEVSGTDVSDGGCDLFVQRVLAGSSDRPRTIVMSTGAGLDDEHTFAVWTRPACSIHTGCVWTHHTPNVGLYLDCEDEHGGVPVCTTDLRATLTLPAGNDIAEVRAGGRALEGDVWPMDITITVSQ